MSNNHIAPISERSRLEDLIDTFLTSSSSTKRDIQLARQRAERIIKRVGLDRVDQFAVRQRLEGLQERWAISFEEEAAIALENRFAHLSRIERETGYSFLPECLQFILYLSTGEPAADFERNMLATKTCPGIIDSSEADDFRESLPEKNGLWDNINYASSSSDDGYLTDAEVTTVAEGAPGLDQPAEDDEILLPVLGGSSLTEDLIFEELSLVEETRIRLNMGESFATESIFVRESLHMLCGLSTDLYDRDDSGLITAMLEHSLGDVSVQASNFLVQKMSAQGSKCNMAKEFINSYENSPVMQRFQSETEAHLLRFFDELAAVEVVTMNRSAPHISMIQLLQQASRSFHSIETLMKVLPQAIESERDINLLNNLALSISEREAIGGSHANADLAMMIQCFNACFKVYWQPIQDWLDGLNPGCRQIAFVKPLNASEVALDLLWARMYLVDRTLSPSFLQPYLDSILTAGKTATFLARLTDRPLRSHAGFPKQEMENLSSPGHLFLEPWQRRLDANLRATCLTAMQKLSVSLRNELIQSWRLDDAFGALRHIYLAEQGHINDKAYASLFRIVDRGGQWIDRFLLTDIFQQAFEGVASVTADRITVSIESDERTRHARERSLVKLESIKIIYALPWPIANLVDKPSLSVYQRVAKLLLQIARAKYCLDQHVGMRYSVLTRNPRWDKLFINLRSCLRWFMNALHSYIALIVIPEVASGLEKSLQDNWNFDTMIERFQRSVASLQRRCFLTVSLAPMHQAIISLLDLAVILVDMHQCGTEPIEEGSRSSSDDEDKKKIRTLSKLGPDAANIARLMEIRSSYRQLLAFVGAGVKEAARTSGDARLNTFADDIASGLENIQY